MSFEPQKLSTFSKKIVDLADQPNMQPHELKEYFDSSPEELRQSHNGLCDALTAKTAASALGFSRTAGVPADTVQAAVENVQQQLNAAVMGNIPSGSVTGDKLAQDVRDRFTAIENAAKSEASTRASGDSNLQNQINALNGKKSEVYIGTYIGDEVATRTIALGFRPRAVILCDNTGRFALGSAFYGGIALDGFPCGPDARLIIVDNGFTLNHNEEDLLRVNMRNQVYLYLAFH